jgi:hypothetical protein
MTDATPHDQSSACQPASERLAANADPSALPPVRWRPTPPWLHAADLEALAQRFAPLDLAQARHLALVLTEGSTPVEILILKLVDAGLTPTEARQFIAELRALRQRPRQP